MEYCHELLLRTVWLLVRTVRLDRILSALNSVLLLMSDVDPGGLPAAGIVLYVYDDSYSSSSSCWALNLSDS